MAWMSIKWWEDKDMSYIYSMRYSLAIDRKWKDKAFRLIDGDINSQPEGDYPDSEIQALYAYLFSCVDVCFETSYVFVSFGIR